MSVNCYSKANDSNFLDTNIKGLSLNSKRAKKGYLFFCLSGSQHRGVDFINDAYKNGAVAIMMEENLKTKIPKNLIVIRVKDVIASLGLMANKFYGYPLDRLDLTAITGTNGKTTITYILENILNCCNRPTAVIGTINYRINNKIFKSVNTTPDILTAHNVIDKMPKNKTGYLLMEVSSHALTQRRIEGLKFDQAIFTNLTGDHLDYHKTKTKYFRAKSLLFTKYLKQNGIAVINVDDPYGIKLLSLIKNNKKNRLFTYGIKRKAQVYAENILFNRNHSSLVVGTPQYKIKLKTNLLGLFNIYNILASISVCMALNIAEKFIKQGLKDVYVPGRLERIPCNDKLTIFIDYAHTEDALSNILLTLRRLKAKARLIVVFGCGGDRDKTKRSKMGRVASELSDFVIITSDNPRSENPADIITDIKRGIRKKNYLSIIDRREAIEKAIDIAQNQDIIVVAGKGHEEHQIIKDKKLVFNDRNIIEKILFKKGLISCLS